MTRLQYHYFPYLKVREELKVGSYIVWPYSPSKISDKAIATAIDLRLATIQDKYGNKINDITIISYRDLNNFSVLEDKRIEEIRVISFLLFFLAAEKSHRALFLPKNDTRSGVSVNWCTSDNFQILHQNFTKKDNWMAPSEGELHSITDMAQISDLRFTAPNYVNTKFLLEYDVRLFNVIKKVFRNRRNSKVKSVISGISWFYHSYKNTHDIDRGSRVAMMGTAFETIFQITSREKKKEYFGENIEKLSRLGRDREFNFKKHHDNVTLTVRGTRKREWAHRYYELRNKVMHGDAIGRKQFNYRGMQHFFIAELLFIHSVKQILSSIREFKYKNYDEVRMCKSPPFIFDCGSLREAYDNALNRLSSIP